MPKKAVRTRYYDINKGKPGATPRYWADFRDFPDVCATKSGREPLRAPGTKTATSDPELAAALADQRLRYYQQKRLKIAHGGGSSIALGAYMEQHLEHKEASPDITVKWAGELRQHLTVAREFFEARLGEGVMIDAIMREDVTAYMTALSQREGKRGKFSARSQRVYLGSLSDLLDCAISDGKTRDGWLNPVKLIKNKPRASGYVKRDWLEIHEAALYLEAARLYAPDHPRAIRFAYPLVATFLLTGAREAEVFGLTINDIDFQAGVVRVEENEFRRVKTATSNRTIPLHPQLEEILTPWVEARKKEGGRLLFPNPNLPGEQKVGDLRKMLDNIAQLAGLPAGRVRTRGFRHTYCAARLQCLDRGEPIAQYTVAQEMGHNSTKLVAQVYGKLGTVRHRSEHLEYRVSQHERALENVLPKMRERASAPRTIQVDRRPEDLPIWGVSSQPTI